MRLSTSIVFFSIIAGAIFASKGVRAQSADRGPRMSDAELLEQMNLEYPGMEAVARSLAEGDRTAALDALARFFRGREEPHDFCPKSPGGFNGTAAEEVLKHRFEMEGVAHEFPDAIDWYYNPTTATDSKHPRNYEWMWVLNRHHEFETLARAYRNTGDEKYAREFARMLESWIRDCPVPASGVWNKPGSPWRTIEAGIRPSTSWAASLSAFRGSPSVSDRLLLDWLKSWIEHAQYLCRHPSTGNWLTMEMNGLYHVGTLIPFAKEADAWRTKGAECLAKEMAVQVYPDGAQFELTPGYHNVALNNMLGIARTAKAYNQTLPADYVAGLEKMFAYDMWIMQPDHRTPDWNDSGHGGIDRLMAKGAELFPNRDDFRWIASNGKEGVPPDHTSHYFPWAGQAVMRSGWDREALFLGFEVGPFGAGHQHEDKLSVVIFFKRPLLVEAGTYTYDASPWRSYALSSRAHNLVLVDGRGQDRKKRRETFVAKQPLDADFQSNDRFDFAHGVYDDGFEGGTKARHTREVLFDKSNKLFVVRDRLESLDEKDHLFEALWHLDAPELSSEPGNGIFETRESSGGGLRLVTQTGDGLSCRVVKGQEKPEVQGWQPLEPHPGVRPIPCVICGRSGRKVDFLTVFQPLATYDEKRVGEVRFENDAVLVKWSDSRETTVSWPK
jgi:hypothetical protein